MVKKEMRQKVIQQLNKLDQITYHKKSEEIFESIIQHNHFNNANTIGITISRYPEVDTKRLIEYAWQHGKTIVVPKCLTKTKEMDFREIQNFDQLETVYMDLQEPIEQETTSYTAKQIDLLIVPGVIFNREGYRIGFGGGYYDRYLAGFQGETISIAFHEQIEQDIPIELHDLPVETIITDLEIIHCQKE